MFAAAGFALEDLAEAGLGVEDAAEESLESHATFEENARAKAQWFAALLPGRMVIADDSGLEVDALDAAPGVRSKRWAGSIASGAALEAENNAALLRALEGSVLRSARYVSVVVAVQGTQEYVARGECAGRILEEAEGSNGFGYDPYFRSDELGATFGVVSREEKALVSHRGRAFGRLLTQLRGAGTSGLSGAR